MEKKDNQSKIKLDKIIEIIRLYSGWTFKKVLLAHLEERQGAHFTHSWDVFSQDQGHCGGCLPAPNHQLSTFLPQKNSKQLSKQARAWLKALGHFLSEIRGLCSKDKGSSTLRKIIA